MKNQVFRILKSEKEKIKSNLYETGYFVAEINSDALTDNEIFLQLMSYLFKFPYLVTNFNSCNDFMTDLDWLNNELSYILIINDFHKIANTSYNEKIKIAESNFFGMLRWLYYWENEVERVTGFWDEQNQIFSGGIAPRKFDIYLVD